MTEKNESISKQTQRKETRRKSGVERETQHRNKKLQAGGRTAKKIKQTIANERTHSHTRTKTKTCNVENATMAGSTCTIGKKNAVMRAAC